MTSKFNIDNRELLQRISCGEAVVGIDFGNLIVRELAAFRLAAMDSKPVEMPLDYLQGHKDGLEFASQLAEANHPETGDWLYDDPIELAKAIRKGPDMPPVQPVADSEPDRNPVLAYADSYRDMAKQGVQSVPIWSVITDLERNIAPLYRHAQPVTVVPDEVTAEYCPALVKYDVTEVDEAWARGFNACRAAMLAAAPQSPGSEPATVPGKWIPVSERMPEREVDVQVYCPDKKEQMVAYLERNELEGYFRFATWRTGDGIYCQPTHWMQLPAGPQEVR